MSGFIHGTIDSPPEFDLRFSKLAHLIGDLPSGYKAQNFPRNVGMNNGSNLVSGREHLTAILLPKGLVVNAITFYASSSAFVTPTNLWFSLRDKSRRLLGITNDNLAGAWASPNPITLNLVVPYTVPLTDYYYLGVMGAAATCPIVMSRQVGSSALTVLPFIEGGIDNTNVGLTTPATAPAQSAVLTTNVSKLYGLVS